MSAMSPVEFTWGLGDFIKQHPDLNQVEATNLRIDCRIDDTSVELHLDPLWKRYVQSERLDDAEWALANHVQRTINEIRYGSEDEPALVLHSLLRPLLIGETQIEQVAQHEWKLFWWNKQPAVIVAQYPCHYRPLTGVELSRIQLTPEEAWMVALAGLSQVSQTLSVRLVTHEVQYDRLAGWWIAYIHHDHSGYAASRIVLPEFIRTCVKTFEQSESDDVDIAIAIPDRNMLIAVPARNDPLTELALDLATTWQTMEYPITQKIFIMSQQSGQFVRTLQPQQIGTFWSRE